MNFPHSWYLAHADVRTYNGVWTSSHVGDFVCVTSFAGDMKKHLVAITGLQLEEQRLLFRGKEKDDDEHLHTAGVKNLSKILLLENKTNKQRKVVEDVKVVEEVERSGELSKASAAIADVRSEVDKLADRVSFPWSFSKYLILLCNGIQCWFIFWECVHYIVISTGCCLASSC